MGLNHKNLLTLHHDNAHSVRATTLFLNDNNAQLLSHPLCSPDLAPTEFLDFEAKIEGRQFTSIAEFLDTFQSLIDKIPKRTWHEAFYDWSRNLKLCVYSNGEYVLSKGFV